MAGKRDCPLTVEAVLVVMAACWYCCWGSVAFLLFLEFWDSRFCCWWAGHVVTDQYLLCIPICHYLILNKWIILSHNYRLLCENVLLDWSDCCRLHNFLISIIMARGGTLPSGQKGALASRWSQVRIPVVAVNLLSVLICCWLRNVVVCERSLSLPVCRVTGVTHSALRA
jgi:hypothetical protein